MKDLELTDIYERRPSPLVNLSTYVNGTWRFSSVAGLPYISDQGQKIYRMKVKFGLVPENYLSPNRRSVTGSPGDYVAVDSLGTMSLITKEQYDMRFPKKRKPAYTVDTSEKLKDPNYITEIVRGSTPTTSNTRPGTTYTPPPPSTSRSGGGSSGGSSGGGGGGGY